MTAPRLVLVFTAGEGISGAVTRWWTWSAVGHVAGLLGYEGADMHPVYLDATPGRGVAVHSDLAGEIVARFTVDCEPEIEARAVQWFAGQAEAGARYDWGAILGMPFRRDWRREGQWDCSEGWARAFEIADFPLVRAEALDRITPRDLMASERLRPA